MKIIFKHFYLFFFISSIYAECSDLDYSLCLTYSEFCTWDEDSGTCYEEGGYGTTGGSGGGGTSYGPYEYSTITEAQGLRNGPDYRDGVVYYPIGGDSPYKSIVLTPGFGGGSIYMSSWAEFFASHGYIAMRIGPNDEVNDSHNQRGEGLLDGIESIRQENTRTGSPLYGLVDTDNFSVSGYSMGGGASHNAAMIDGTIKAIISLNPTVIFEDCDVCIGAAYCICLVPEFVNHSVPSLIFAGEFEVNELESYDGLLGQDVYENMPSTTDKIIFEGAGSGHGFAESPYGEVAEYALNWLNYQLSGDSSACESLLVEPLSASLYSTNLDCEGSTLGDLNGDSLVNIQDIILTVNYVLSGDYSSSADLNSDGSISILDIVQLINIVLAD